MERKAIAILLAAGSGKRMGTATPKQFLEIDGKMIFKHSLDVFETSDIISSVIVVTSADMVGFVSDETKDYHKVAAVIPGGKERYLSVWEGLKEACKAADKDDIVMIHDSARPYIDEPLLERLYNETLSYDATIAAVRVKDTIKQADESGFISATPDRSTLWAAQTPQSFRLSLIYEAYKKLYDKYGENATVTDDAQVAELMMGTKVKLVQGSYANIKITVPEDLK